MRIIEIIVRIRTNITTKEKKTITDVFNSHLISPVDKYYEQRIYLWK